MIKHTVAVIAWGSLVACLAAQAPPTLSTEEMLRWQNLQLRTQLETAMAQWGACQAQVGQWRAQAQSTTLTAEEFSLQRAVEAQHPGFVWDPKTGAFSAKPEPPKERP